MTDRQHVGIIHPGEMGISVAATVQNSGYSVAWASEGRSPQTGARAEKYALYDVHSLSRLCKSCSVIISVCPPHAAEEVATSVLSHHFSGVYLDANAISPQRSRHIAKAFTNVDVSFVDGGIIGGPAWSRHSTWLYLSGRAANEIAAYFSAGPLETVVLGNDIGKASALKMCYAAYTKGTTALLSAVLAAAEALDVRSDLEGQWSCDGSELAEGAAKRVTRVTRKAWRFAGEMDEIADTFRAAGVPDGFHHAAADIYRRMTVFTGSPELPPLEDVLQTLLQNAVEDSTSEPG